jgi:glycosyltransferase involved in cell wall biosynthesis
MIRVLHVIDSLGTGGAERQLVLTLLRSSNVEFQHTVCALGAAGTYGEMLRARGIPVVALDRSPRREAVRTLRELRGVIDRTAPDLIHVSLYYAGILGRVAGRLAGKPVVTTLVNTTYEPEWSRDNPRLTPLKVAAVRGIDGLTARWWGTWFVAVTEAVRTSAIRQLGISPAKVSVIPRGLELGQFVVPTTADVAALRREIGAETAFPLILSVGRLVPQKGHRYAIEAMRQIVARFPTAVYVIAGEGTLRPALTQQIHAAGMAGRVRLLGARQDIPALLAAADLFAFPSLFEGFGGALVEAMAMGRPCVSARFAGSEELTDGGRTACLVPVASPEALADALSALAARPDEAVALGEAAQAWARARYDLDETIGALERLYERVLARRANPVAAGAGDDADISPRGHAGMCPSHGKPWNR